MHEVIAFLFGALSLFTGWYVWYTRRRFKALKDHFTWVAGRAESAERRVELMGNRVGRQTEQLADHQHMIQFLADNRTIPARGDPNRDLLEAEKEDRRANVWDRLKDDVEKL